MDHEYEIIAGSLPDGEGVRVEPHFGLPIVRGCRRNPAGCERRKGGALGDKCGSDLTVEVGNRLVVQPNCGGEWR